jgi:hypothetical protein
MRELILQDKSRAEAESAKLRDEHVAVVARVSMLVCCSFSACYMLDRTILRIS